MHNYKSFTDLLFSDMYCDIINDYNKITIGKYFCEICKKHFTRKGNLMRHNINSHFKERKFTCLYCNKRYIRKENLKKHQSKFKHIIH